MYLDRLLGDRMRRNSGPPPGSQATKYPRIKNIIVTVLQKDGADATVVLVAQRVRGGLIGGTPDPIRTTDPFF